jgi:ribosome-interacting GTPase 1
LKTGGIEVTLNLSSVSKCQSFQHSKNKIPGGINVTLKPGVQLMDTDEETITSVCKEYRISNATIAIKESCTIDDIIDVLEGNRK